MSTPVRLPDEVTGRVHAICLALPEVTVRRDDTLSPARSAAYSFEIRRRSFCLLIAVAGSDGAPVTMLVLRAPGEDRDALLAAGYPFFAPRAGAGRVGVVLGAGTDWTEIRELVTDSYRVLAPKKLSALLGDR